MSAHPESVNHFFRERKVNPVNELLKLEGIDFFQSSWFIGNSSVYVFFPKPNSSSQTQGDGEDGTAVGYIWCADKPQRSQGLKWWNNGYSVGVKNNDMYNDLRFEEYSGLPIRAVLSDSVIN